MSADNVFNDALSPVLAITIAPNGRYKSVNELNKSKEIKPGTEYTRVPYGIVARNVKRLEKSAINVKGRIHNFTLNDIRSRNFSPMAYPQ